MNKAMQKNSGMHPINPTSRINYLKQCNKNIELALPLISKIKDRELMCSDYPLQAGHFDALRMAIEIEPDMIQRITLNNCGLDDNTVS